MKAKLAMALSLVGVLGAGSAAALVNTQILDSAPVESGASKAVLPPAPTVQLTVPDSGAAASGLPASTTSTSTSTPLAPAEAAEATTTTSTTSTTSTTTTAAPTSDLLTSFEVGDAGTVTVDVVDGALVLVAAEPKPGWSLTKAEDDSNDDSDEQENEVEVVFTSATVSVEFEAHLVDGQIVPHVESRAIGSAASPTTTAEQRTTDRVDDFDDDRGDDHDDYDDDRDDDRDERDERDDDDERDERDDDDERDERDDDDDDRDDDRDDDHRDERDDHDDERDDD